MAHNSSHDSAENEKKTLIVIIFTLITMAAEIVYGYVTHSMALLADGFHMGTHALALILTFAAYILIRKCSGMECFPNGTEKIGTLAAYTSSLFLGVTGIWVIAESIERFFHPLQIQFNEAILVAIIGFTVNIICIIVMRGKHTHCHGEETERNSDYNFKAAYYHILADVLTSVLAIAALFTGKYLHIIYCDSLVGLLGGLLIVKWAISLIKNTVSILIDMKRV